MSLCVYSVFVLSCVHVEALHPADPPSKEFRLYIESRNWKAFKAQQWAYNNNNNNNYNNRWNGVLFSLISEVE
jgi:hypothetical protein